MSPSQGAGYRKDIDGLRAVAVLLVVVYHVWLDRVSGGVDAFLMISAFFLAGSFIRRLEAGTPLRVVGQWIRTFKRMLPAAAVVITATVLAGSFFLPASNLPDLWRQAWASVLYFENWVLAADSVDYYADNSLASPLQHFWSLSVQGQIFLLWPLLFALIASIRWVFRIQNVRVLALASFTLLFFSSLVYSIVTTQAHQESAYFNTGARLWEFAAGSILAIVLPWIKLPDKISGIIGWVGLIALVACGMVLDVRGGFPGYLALWPVLSVAAVILAGSATNRRFGPARILETKPILALGRDSYGLYLVHWPLLVYVLVARRGEPLNFGEGLLLIVASIGLARLVTSLVDSPIRGAKWANANNMRGFLVILASLALVAIPTTLLQQSHARQAEKIASASDHELSRNNPGAAALSPDWVNDIDPGWPRIPLATELEKEWGSLPEDCTNLSDLPNHAPPGECQTNGNSEGQLSIVVVGDSHPEQWLEPLLHIAKEEDWLLISLLKGGCSFGLTPVSYYADADFGAECWDWNVEILDFLVMYSPDLVISVGSMAQPTDMEQPKDAGELERINPDSPMVVPETSR